MALALLCSQVSAFSPQVRSPSSSSFSPTALGVSMVSSFIDPSYDNSRGSSKKLSRPQRKKLERSRKRSRKTGFYQLNSNHVSYLSRDSTPDNVMTAIKRAQNLHDANDIRVIGRFLLEGVDDTFAYGYKGSLLARFAVAALRLEEYEIAQDAIQMREDRFASSMAPFESAAIIRGWNRADKMNEAFSRLEKELAVPSDHKDAVANKDVIKHRAQSLGSIASRHFYEHDPTVALKACNMLTELAPLVRASGLTEEDLRMAWSHIIDGSVECGPAFESIARETMKAFPLEEK